MSEVLHATACVKNSYKACVCGWTDIEWVPGTLLNPIVEERQNSLGLQLTSSSAIAEIARQGALVLAKSGRLELGDNNLRT